MIFILIVLGQSFKYIFFLLSFLSFLFLFYVKILICTYILILISSHIIKKKQHSKASKYFFSSSLSKRPDILPLLLLDVPPEIWGRFHERFRDVRTASFFGLVNRHRLFGNINFDFRLEELFVYPLLASSNWISNFDFL